MMYGLTMYDLFYTGYQQLRARFISKLAFAVYRYKCAILQSRNCSKIRSAELHRSLPPNRRILHSPDDLSHLPFLFKFFVTTVTVTLAIRREPVRFLPGTPGSPDAVYVRILVPLATRLMFNSKLCLSAVIRAFALEAIALCSRCIRLLRLFRVRA